jgi:tetratricopeptide (TPR) repeat protein
MIIFHYLDIGERLFMKTKLYYSVLLAIFILSGCTTDKGFLNSSNIRIYSYILHRATLYKQQKKYDLALRDYSEAIKIYPKGDHVYWIRAELYKQQKEYDLSLADLNKAIELNPSSMYYKVRGSVYYMKKQYDSAIKEYAKAIRLNNNYAEAYNSLAWLLSTCSDEKYRNGIKAIEYAKKAVDLDPESQMFDTLAAAYAEAGNFDMALKSQEKAIELLIEEGRSDNMDGFEKHLESYKKDIPWTDTL